MTLVGQERSFNVEGHIIRSLVQFTRTPKPRKNDITKFQTLFTLLPSFATGHGSLRTGEIGIGGRKTEDVHGDGEYVRVVGNFQGPVLKLDWELSVLLTVTVRVGSLTEGSLV